MRCIFTFALGQAANSLSSKCTQGFCLTINMCLLHTMHPNMHITHTFDLSLVLIIFLELVHMLRTNDGFSYRVMSALSSFILLYSHFHLSCQWAFSRNLHTLNCLPLTSLTLSKPLFLSFLFWFFISKRFFFVTSSFICYFSFHFVSLSILFL